MYGLSVQPLLCIKRVREEISAFKMQRCKACVLLHQSTFKMLSRVFPVPTKFSMIKKTISTNFIEKKCEKFWTIFCWLMCNPGRYCRWTCSTDYYNKDFLMINFPLGLKKHHNRIHKEFLHIECQPESISLSDDELI